MKGSMNIAVVGSGIAGTASAWQLARLGHSVTLFEQAQRCGPVGAGILLQPSGQAVLERLGVLAAVKANAATIHSLHAKHRSGRTLVHLPYKKLSPLIHGMGVRRSTIFQLLFDSSVAAGVEVREDARVDGYSQTADQVALTSEGRGELGSFDLVVAADGSRSRLREQSGLTRSVREYPDAAFWTVGPYSGAGDCLTQIVGRCGRLIGMLPVGEGRCSFFWGLAKSEEAATRQAGVDAFRRQVADFYPAAEEAVSELTSFDEVPYATYRTARMKSVVDGRVVFVGDAAHATSPHLGQGLNLALQDALALTDQMQADVPVHDALKHYEQARRSTNGFYSVLTGTLTPFFQTSSRFQQLGRDLALPVMPHLPYVGKQMVYTMAGLKTGWLSQKAVAR